MGLYKEDSSKCPVALKSEDKRGRFCEQHSECALQNMPESHMGGDEVVCMLIGNIFDMDFESYSLLKGLQPAWSGKLG